MAEYKITITRTKIKEILPTQNYERIRDKDPDNPDADQWGYVTKPAHQKEVTETVLEQIVEDINILDVVGAINGATFT